jgi:predicted lipoprotein
VTRLVVVALACAVVASACADDGPSRADVLGDYAVEVARPGYADFAGAAGELAAAVAAACDDASSENVAGLIDDVDALRLDWMRLRAMSTGPVMERRSDALVDWPIRAADIETFVESAESGSITPEVVAKNVGADTRGLTALRFVVASDDSPTLLTDRAWCDYAESVAVVVADEATVVAETWVDLTEQFGDDAAADDWVEMVVNDDINVVHKLTEEPRDLGDAPPDAAADRAAQMTGLADVWRSFGPMLPDDLAERLTSEIEAARTAYADGDIDRGRELAREVEATLATEVAAHLDVTIGFSDADGDSAG